MKTSLQMSAPVSYEPPRVAWSLPNGSMVTGMRAQRAGQSTRQVSLPPPFIDTVPRPPQEQV